MFLEPSRPLIGFDSMPLNKAAKMLIRSRHQPHLQHTVPAYGKHHGLEEQPSGEGALTLFRGGDSHVQNLLLDLHWLGPKLGGHGQHRPRTSLAKLVARCSGRSSLWPEGQDQGRKMLPRECTTQEWHQSEPNLHLTTPELLLKGPSGLELCET